MVKVHSLFDPPGDDGISFEGEESLTHQEFKEECDINTIMARYVQTGVAPTDARMASYGDFAEAPDFQEAQAILLRAGEQFAALPGPVRARFENDPVKFLEFVHDSKNLDEAFKLGLLSEEYAKREGERVKVANAAAAAAAGGK